MAEEREKRMIDSSYLGGAGGSVPKKAKTEIEESDSAFLARSRTSSVSSSTTRPVDPGLTAERILRLKELELFLLSKGVSDEIIAKIKRMRPEDAYSPHEEDVQKVVEGFDEKAWGFLLPADNDVVCRLLDGDFTSHDLYRQLALANYRLPCYTTYKSDQECLYFLQELKQEAERCLSQYDISVRGLGWSWEGLGVTYKVAEKYPHVEKYQLLRAFQDLYAVHNWNTISRDVEEVLLEMWDMVTEEGRDTSFGALLDFDNPTTGVHVKQMFYEVFDAYSSCSEEDIIPEDIIAAFQKTWCFSGEELFWIIGLIKSSCPTYMAVNGIEVERLLEYYPTSIKRKMEIAKQIGII